jgi:hypothetical protein
VQGVFLLALIAFIKHYFAELFEKYFGKKIIGYFK